MAIYISKHARYRLAASAFGAAGGLLCLGALTTGHGMTLLVAGMLSCSASMLVMSLRPRQEASRVTATEGARDDRDGQTVEVSIRKIGIDGRKAGPPEPERGRTGSGNDWRDELDGGMELRTEMGRKRPRERKSLTWSI
jgi:hypothetical protein